MNSFTYLIVDDEPNAIRLLQKTIAGQYDNLHLLGTYTSVDTAVDALTKNNADILFLDISMPHKTGLELLEQMPDLQSEVIFITAHEEYALTAFNFTPAGYILKPINHLKLFNTIDKALQRVHDKRLAVGNQEKVLHNNNKIGIRNSKGIDYVNIEDIFYMEATSRCTKIVTKEKVYLSSCNLGKLKMLVESHCFYNIHRSFIVNVNKVIRYESAGIVITEGGHEIPVSKNAREEFLHLFKG